MNQATTVRSIISEMQKHGLPIEIGPTLSAAASNALQDVTIQRISAMENAGPGDLVFMDKKEYVELLKQRTPTAVVTNKVLAPLLSDIAGLHVLIAPYVPLAHALIKSRFGARDFAKAGWERIHPSSVIHESAEIHPSAFIEPRAVVGARVKIGAEARVMAGVVVEHDAVVGERSVLHPSSVLGYGCRLGNDVVVGSGSVIGSEGYGFAQDQARKSYPIPQTGIVVLEDRVRLGANCCIDRATYRETRIGAGTKLDNLCHIAHNVEIGQDCLLTSMLCVAGSTKIGNRVITSGQTGIIDHITVCDDAVLLHRAGVTKDIDKPGAYAGLPTQPLTDYLKNSAVLRNAVELKKRVSDLEASSPAKS